MNKVLFTFELRYWLLRKSTLFILAVWAGIIGYSAWNGSQKVQWQEKQFAGKLQEDKQRHQELIARMDSFENGLLKANLYWEDARNAFDMGSYLGTWTLVKPSLPLAAIDLGQTHLFPAYNQVTTNNGYWFMALRKSENLDNPAKLLFGHFDLSFALIWLFPLIIISLNFNILSAEKEQGTLTMLLTQGITVGQVLRQKCLFRFSMLTLFTVCMALLFLNLFGNRLWQDLTSTGSLLLLIILYSAIWHVSAVAVNYMGNSSNFNMGWLFASWLGLVILLPVLLNVCISTFYQVPGKLELINEVREKLTEYDQKNSLILDQYYTDHPQFVSSDSSFMMPLFMYKLAIRERSTAEAMYPVIRQYQEQMLKQTKLISSLAYISPAILMQESLEELSGHSTRQFIEFAQAADQINRKWREYFFPLSMASKFLTVQQFRQLPQPGYQPQINSQKIMYLLTGLLVWLGLTIWWSIRQEQKFKMHT